MFLSLPQTSEGTDLWLINIFSLNLEIFSQKSSLLMEYETLDGEDLQLIIEDKWSDDDKKSRLKKVEELHKKQVTPPPPPPVDNSEQRSVPPKAQENSAFA